MGQHLTILASGPAMLRFVLLLVTLPLHYTKNNYASQAAAKGVMGQFEFMVSNLTHVLMHVFAILNILPKSISAVSFLVPIEINSKR